MPTIVPISFCSVRQVEGEVSSPAGKGRLRGSIGLGCVLAAVFSLTATAFAGGPSWEPTQRRLAKTLPAEFSQQDAVLIGWDDEDAGLQAAVVDIVAAAHDRIRFYMLVPSVSAEIDALRQLRDHGVPRYAVKFLQVPTDSIWTRDYGPMVVLHHDGGCQMVDSDYGHGDRAGDDLVPAAIAPTLGMDTLRPPITADGGNIQTNGRGLALTTTAILAHNVDRGYTETHVARLFRDFYGISQLVFLEPLAGETTGHVDMFAVFVGPNTVAVGQYDPEEDPQNAAILDRNAGRLAAMETADGPLRVVRVPMPPHDQKVWRTYTNVLFANGTLLVPQYPGIDPRGHTEAISIYRRLLPGWKVVGIDCTSLIQWGGAIHCVTMNLCRVPSVLELTQQLSRGRTDRRPTRPAPGTGLSQGRLNADPPLAAPRPDDRDELDDDAGRPPSTGRFPPLIIPIRERDEPRRDDTSDWKPASSREPIVDPEPYPRRFQPGRTSQPPLQGRVDFDEAEPESTLGTPQLDEEEIVRPQSQNPGRLPGRSRQRPRTMFQPDRESGAYRPR